MNHQLKNLVVEIYKADGNRFCIVSRSIEEVQSELKRLVGHINPKPILDELSLQRKDPKRFPNVIIFLNEEDRKTNLDCFLNETIARKVK